MKAVVIGGAGFLGRRMVELLAGEPLDPRWPRYASIHILDTQPLRPVESTRVAVTSQIGDIREPSDLREALAGADTVFHAASVVDVSLSPHPRIEEVNVRGARNVVEACVELGVPRLVYTSSEDVLLCDTPVRGADESAPYPARAIHAYVATKIEGEKIALGADRRGGLRTVSIRPVHIYGPGDPHAIVTSLRAFRDGSVPFLLGDGSARFDVVYVDNVAHAHFLAAHKLSDPDSVDAVGGRAYFAGEDHAPNYFDWLRPYAEQKGIRMPTRRLGRRRTHLLASAMELFGRLTRREPTFHRFHAHVIGEDFFFDHSRAKRELGYAPIVDKEEALRRTIAWLDSAM
ncbi:MAG: NAD-dependent epimerase/dehydratase family protein [Sandaracinaceae bacterium]